VKLESVLVSVWTTFPLNRFCTHNWTKFGEVGGRVQKGLNIRFTVNGENLYAIILGNWPGAEAVVTSLSEKVGKIESVTQLEGDGQLEFTQDAGGLKLKLPATAPGKYAYVLKITGLKMNPPMWTISSNPILLPTPDEAEGR
jgi:alpha-L-fucosidase